MNILCVYYVYIMYCIIYTEYKCKQMYVCSYIVYLQRCYPSYTYLIYSLSLSLSLLHTFAHSTCYPTQLTRLRSAK